jgi:hypothetical protein
MRSNTRSPIQAVSGDKHADHVHYDQHQFFDKLDHGQYELLHDQHVHYRLDHVVHVQHDQYHDDFWREYRDLLHGGPARLDFPSYRPDLSEHGYGRTGDAGPD